MAKHPDCPARTVDGEMCRFKRDHDSDHAFGPPKYVIELTSKELIELRDYAASAIRSGYGSKAARRRMVALCEHKLLRTLFSETAAPLIHGHPLGTERLRDLVRNQRTHRDYLNALSRTPCGITIGGQEPVAQGPRNKVTCEACLKKGCRA